MSTDTVLMQASARAKLCILSVCTLETLEI